MLLSIKQKEQLHSSSLFKQLKTNKHKKTPNPYLQFIELNIKGKMIWLEKPRGENIQDKELKKRFLRLEPKQGCIRGKIGKLDNIKSKGIFFIRGCHCKIQTGKYLQIMLN